jgi:hypothetical protein
VYIQLFPSNGCCTVVGFHSCYMATGLHDTILFSDLASPVSVSDQKSVYISYISHACSRPSPLNFLSFDHRKVFGEQVVESYPQSPITFL